MQSVKEGALVCCTSSVANNYQETFVEPLQSRSAATIRGLFFMRLHHPQLQNFQQERSENLQYYMVIYVNYYNNINTLSSKNSSSCQTVSVVAKAIPLRYRSQTFG